MNSPIPPEYVHENIDPQWFYDYATFSGMFRHYAAESLYLEFHRDANDFQRRLYLVGLYREEYSAYEDIGAILSAFIKWKNGSIKFPISEILTYRPVKVIFIKIFLKHFLFALLINCTQHLILIHGLYHVGI